MSDRTMRAKMRVANVTPRYNAEDKKTQEVLQFSAVAKSSSYPEDGSDEDNSFARWTPSASVDLVVANPALFDQFAVGDVFYVDFVRAAKE